MSNVVTIYFVAVDKEQNNYLHQLLSRQRSDIQHPSLCDYARRKAVYPTTTGEYLYLQIALIRRWRQHHYLNYYWLPETSYFGNSLFHNCLTVKDVNFLSKKLKTPLKIPLLRPQGVRLHPFLSQIAANWPLHRNDHSAVTKSELRETSSSAHSGFKPSGILKISMLSAFPHFFLGYLFKGFYEFFWKPDGRTFKLSTVQQSSFVKK